VNSGIKREKSRKKMFVDSNDGSINTGEDKKRDANVFA